MFTSQKLRAIRPEPASEVRMREQRLDDVLHLVEVHGVLDLAGARQVWHRLDAALADGVRWCVVDLSGAPHVGEPMIHALVAAARALRERRGELIVAGSEPTVHDRLEAYDASSRPALAATVDQALMILKMLRPKTAIRRPAQPSQPRRRTTSLTLPRIEPSH